MALKWDILPNDAATANGKRGKYYVSKCFVDGHTLYPLYFERECLKFCESGQEAAHVANEHDAAI